jgi:hypothetical protein
MSKPIEVHDTHSTVLIFPEHISAIFPASLTIAMDCVYGDGNGLLHLDEESFNRVMEEASR